MACWIYLPTTPPFEGNLQDQPLQEESSEEVTGTPAKNYKSNPMEVIDSQNWFERPKGRFLTTSW